MTPSFLAALSAIGILLIVALLRLIHLLQQKSSGRLTGRPEKSLKAFARQADSMAVSLRVARETYDLLLEHYPAPMCIDPQDDLRRQLDLTEDDLHLITDTLWQKTGRLLPKSLDLSSIRTVKDLLIAVETARRSKIDRATLRLRASDCSYPVRPAVEVLRFRATTKIMDPDYQRRQRFKWLRRRISDYRGLLSRATDEAPRQPYPGPFRRSNEKPRSSSPFKNR